MNEEVRLETVHIHSRADELIACLEGEIAKRDEVIVGLANSRDFWREKAITADDELAAIKAQGVVMPDTEDFCFCGKHVSLQMISGGASNHGYLGSVTLLIDGEYVEYTRLNAAPVQQVSVPDGWRVERGYSSSGYVLHSPSGSMIRVCDSGGGGIETAFALFLKAMLAAAPAAPAADAGIVDMYRHLQQVTPYRFKKIQDASITDGGDVMYFHKDRFDAALLADMAAHRSTGVV